MKLGPVTKIEERNTTTLKEFKDYGMPENCDIIVIFPFYGQFGVIPDAWPVKLIFSSIGTFYHKKTENKIKECLTQLPYY